MRISASTRASRKPNTTVRNDSETVQIMPSLNMVRYRRAARKPLTESNGGPSFFILTDRQTSLAYRREKSAISLLFQMRAYP